MITRTTARMVQPRNNTSSSSQPQLRARATLRLPQASAVSLVLSGSTSSARDTPMYWSTETKR